MNEPVFKVGDRVVVRAILNGYGKDLTGRVTEIQSFMGQQLLFIDYDVRQFDGRTGIVAYSYQQIDLLK